MTRQEREGWTIVAGLFVALMLVFGSGYHTAGVFFGPLLKHFGWSRAQVSTLPALLSASAGVTGALDMTRSYTVAFELFIATLLIGAAALFACLPLTVDESHAPAATPRAA